MSLDVFQAYVNGYSDRLLDQQILALQTGYWAAYYTGKHPKSVKDVSEKIMRVHKEQEHKQDKNTPRPEVDVEAFIAQEARFQEALKARQVSD